MSTNWKLSQNCDSFQFVCGGRSSVGRAPDCDSGCRGFKSHRPPHFSIRRHPKGDWGYNEKSEFYDFTVPHSWIVFYGMYD